jgi:hypothetical protein
MEEETGNVREIKMPPKGRRLYTVVQAGRRSYTFDVKTKHNDYFLEITETKMRLHEDGTTSEERHIMFLFDEDFELFTEGLQQMINYVRVALPHPPLRRDIVLRKDLPHRHDIIAAFHELEKEEAVKSVRVNQEVPPINT